MRILYNSVSPTVKSGYGRCTAELVYRLMRRHEVVVYAYYGVQQSTLTITLTGPDGDREVKVVGGNGSIYHPKIPEDQWNFDLMIAHFDIWFAERFNPAWINSIRIPIVWWAVIDHDPLPFPIRRLMRRPNVYVVPMTKWGKEVIERAREPFAAKVLDPIPHGIDVDEWKPLDREVPGIPKDAEFVVCTVAANTGLRENIPGMIEAFAAFVKLTEADAYYYIHAAPNPEPGTSGYYLYEVVKACEEVYGVNLKGRIVFKGSYGRYPDEFLRAVYTLADVHLLTILGGSFEIPVLEAACCGTPSVVTYFSGPRELVGDVVGRIGRVLVCERGLAVEPAAPLWMNLSSSRQFVPNPLDVAEALRLYYEDPQLAEDHVRAMREWIAENATWDAVADKWFRAIEEVWEDVQK